MTFVESKTVWGRNQISGCKWLGTSYSEGVKEAFDNPGSISYLDYYVTQLYLAKLIALHI